MNRIFRSLSLLVLVAVPALALARPPLIYHHLTKLPAHPGDTVRLRLSQQNVVIHISADNSLTVSTDIWADTRSADTKAKIINRLAPKVSTRDREVLIRTPEHHSWGWNFHFGSSAQARVTITMPASMAVNYRLGSGNFQFVNPGASNPIKGNSGSGNVVVKSASAQVVAKTGSGDFLIELDRASQQVQLSTGSGNINFSGTSDSLQLSTGSGDVRISNASAKQVRISTGSGNITAHWHDLAAASLQTSSGSGNLLMVFPSDSKLSGTLSTGSGEVNTDFAATIHSNRHSYTLAGDSSDAVQLNASTGSGDITLRKGS